MNTYDRRKLAFTEKTGEIFAIISGIFLCVSTIFMFTNMLTRTIADFNIRLVYEFCGLCAAGVASFAIPYATLKSAHSAMDIITSHLSVRVEAACEAISGVITSAIMTFVVFVLVKYAYQRTLVLETTTTSKLPTYLFRWIFAAGMLFTLIAAIIEMIDMFRIAAGKSVVRSQEAQVELEGAVPTDVVGEIESTVDANDECTAAPEDKKPQAIDTETSDAADSEGDEV